MKGDLGCDNCVGKGEERQEVYERLRELEQGSRRVSSAEELEALEREIRTCTDTLASVLLERHVQASLDAEAQREKEAELIRSGPAKMKHEGYEWVRIRTVSGLCITVRARYYRRLLRYLRTGLYASQRPAQRGLCGVGVAGDSGALYALVGCAGERLVGVVEFL